ncbi:WD40-repeat-containing domain protein [Flagelloscypha sp. PMI_526]|nr:WD40-repeat-containing domain protein [Flagelloscypha sp. PMI_526]
MSGQLRAELEAKKARLQVRKAELEELKIQRIARRNNRLGGGGGTETAGGATSDIGTRKKELYKLVDRLLGETSDSRRHKLEQTVQPEGSVNASGTDTVPEKPLPLPHTPALVDLEQELFELPPKERVLYSKEIQTIMVELDNDSQVTNSQLQQERESAFELERKALEDEVKQLSEELERAIELEIRELSEEEKSNILVAPDFVDFVEQSTKYVHRILNDTYDFMEDYVVNTDNDVDNSEGNRVVRVCEFYDEMYTKNRSITDIDWSPKFPELSVASYSKNRATLNEPEGIVAVWNLRMVDRPEFVFYAQSDVLSVTFSPFHPNLIFGGTYSGQILLWDTRSKHLPVLKTPLSAATGHTHPVHAIRMVGTHNANNLITTSTDGLVCSWLVDMLAQPQDTLELFHTGHHKTNEVAITSLDFPDNDTSTFWVGTEEGNVYHANRYDQRAGGSKAGLNQNDVYKGHFAPITGLHFHPLSSQGSVDFSDIFLTSSVDWTVKLWRAHSLRKPSTTPRSISPLYSFDEAGDYVYDVRWHPTHPAVFGTVDGMGKFDVWNLNVNTEVPVTSTSIPSKRAINKFQWDRKEGRRAALGGSDGRLYIYDIGDLAVPHASEWSDLQKTFERMQSENGGGAGWNQRDDVRHLAGR